MCDSYKPDYCGNKIGDFQIPDPHYEKFIPDGCIELENPIFIGKYGNGYDSYIVAYQNKYVEQDFFWIYICDANNGRIKYGWTRSSSSKRLIEFLKEGIENQHNSNKRNRNDDNDTSSSVKRHHFETNDLKRKYDDDNDTSSSNKRHH